MHDGLALQIVGCLYTGDDLAVSIHHLNGQGQIGLALLSDGGAGLGDEVVAQPRSAEQCTASNL